MWILQHWFFMPSYAFKSMICLYSDCSKYKLIILEEDNKAEEAKKMAEEAEAARILAEKTASDAGIVSSNAISL